MEFRHPKYYAALRAERKKLQASSAKPQAAQPDQPSAKLKLQVPSSKRQAPSVKLQANKKNPGNFQAPSIMAQDPGRILLDP